MNRLLKELLPAMRVKAAGVFKQDGYHVPLFFLNLNGELKLVSTKFFDLSDKDAMHRLLLDGVRNGLKEFASISEAWMARGTPDHDPMEWGKKHGTLINFPGRVETLCFQYANPEEDIIATADIFRPADSQPFVGPWEVLENKFDRREYKADLPRFGASIWVEAAQGSN